MDASDVSSGAPKPPECYNMACLLTLHFCVRDGSSCVKMQGTVFAQGDMSGQNWNLERCLLQVMVFAEWRAALWGVLHGTHRSKPSQQGHISTFQEDMFVFTWLRLQKAIDRLLRVASESGADVGSVPELQRLQGISNQVRSFCCMRLACQPEPYGSGNGNGNFSYGQTHPSYEYTFWYPRRPFRGGKQDAVATTQQLEHSTMLPSDRQHSCCGSLSDLLG